jgi:transposase-like protein
MDGFRAWLCAIARNVLHNHYRQKKTVSLDQSDPDAFCSGSENPSETLIHQEELAMLEQAMMRIPVEYREPLVMFYRQHQSTRQVAESLGLNESTVRTRLHRARQMLREEIAARLERTLEQTAPGKAFTKAVMAGIGAGLAAGAAGTASAAAAMTGATGTGTSAATGLAAVMSTVTAKILTAAAVATIAIGGVYTYKYLSKPDQPPIQSGDMAVVTPNLPLLEAKEQNTLHIVTVQPSEEYKGNSQIHTELAVQRSKSKTENAFLVSRRHPDWPRLNEPVENIYMRTSGDQTWIQLPQRFRQEDEQSILIDNARERIRVNKMDKTVQYSATSTNQDTPVYRNNQPLASLEAVQFAFLFGHTPNLSLRFTYEVHEIGQEENGKVLVYTLQSRGLEDSDYKATAYVDTETLLPEEIVVVNIDPNSPTNGQVIEKIVLTLLQSLVLFLNM